MNIRVESEDLMEMVVCVNGRELTYGVDYRMKKGSVGVIEFYGLLRGPMWVRRLFSRRRRILKKSDTVTMNVSFESIGRLVKEGE